MANSSVKIETKSISEKIIKIVEKQKSINEAYDKIKKTKETLQTSWKGNSATKFYQAFNIIKDRMDERVKPVDDHYIPFLQDYIVNGYGDVEEINKKLGKSFEINEAIKEFL